MSRLMIKVALSLACMAVTPLHAQEADERGKGLSFKLPKCCKPQPDKQTNDYFIDGITLETDNREGYRDLKAVRVIVVNVNPFLYEYHIDAKATPLPEATISQITAVLGFPAAAMQKRMPWLSVRQSPPPQPQGFVPFSGPTCSANGKRVFESLARKVRSDSATVSAVDALLQRIQRVAQDADAERKRANEVLLEKNTYGSDKWYDTAVKTAGNLETAASQNRRSATTGEAERKRAEAAVEKTSKDIADFAKQHPACSGDLLKEAVDSLTAHLAVQRADFVKAVDHADATEKAAALLTKTGGMEEQYYRMRTIPRSESASKIEIAVKRKSPKDQDFPKDPIVVRTLNSGGKSILSIAAGVMWSDMINEDYAVQKRTVNGSAVNMVVRTGRATQRIVPMGTVNARPFRTAPLWATQQNTSGLWRVVEIPADFAGRLMDDVQFSFGAGVDTDDINVEYFIGGGLNIFSDRLMLGVGRYAGRRHMLPTDLHVGDTVPDTTSASFKIDESRTWSWGIGVFYTVRN